MLDRIYKLIIIVLFSLLSTIQVFAQNRTIRFDRISTKDGLSESTVNKIYQDRKGFMWFCTFDGLSRFDGRNFKNFRSRPNDPTSISCNIVRGITEDKFGYLWVATDKGLNRYNPKTETFEQFYHSKNDPQSIQDNSLTNGLYTDKDGNVWISYTQSWVSRIVFDSKTNRPHFKNYDSELQQRFKGTTVFGGNSYIYQDKKHHYWLAFTNGVLKLDFSPKDLSINNTKYLWSEHLDELNIFPTGITESETGEIWIATFSGLLRFIPDKEEFCMYREMPENPTALTKPFLTDILIDKSNRLWISINTGGVNSIDLNDKMLYKANNPNYKTYYPKFNHYYNMPENYTSLPNNIGFSLYEDKGGVLWVGFQNGGLGKFNLYTTTFQHYDIVKPTPNMVDHFVESIYEDKDGILWVGTSNEGLARIDKKKNLTTFFKHQPKDASSISHNRVSYIKEDSYGRFWIGTDGGGLNLMDKKTGKFTHYHADYSKEHCLTSENIIYIFEDSKKQVWIGCWNGGLHKIITTDHSSIKFQRYFTDQGVGINSICEDSDHSLWLARDGGREGALVHFYPETNKISLYDPNPEDPFAITQNYIYTIFKDSKNNIWLGTPGGGINKMEEPERNGQKAKFSVINEQMGLCNNYILSILEDNAHDLWFATLDGITRYNPKNKSFHNFYEENGLQSNVFYRNAAYKNSKGILYFGGSNGLNEINPNEIKTNTHVPNIVITDFEIFNKSVKPSADSPLRQSIAETSQIELSYKEYSFSFKFAALDYAKPIENQYTYKLDGFDKEWIPSCNRNYASYTKIPPGRYVFRVKGSNNDQVWNETGASIIIIITPPFRRTWWFYTLSVASIISLIFLYIKWRVRSLKANMDRLEQIVVERTREITDQKNEIEGQRDQLTKQKKNIMDSIMYAKRIQTAVLPPENLLSEILPNHFVVYMPRDIVSGDYYWINKKQKYLIIAAGDCTGHGVPGAFMSMLGIAFLNEIVTKNYDQVNLQANTILNELREKVKESLHQTGKENEAKDGMDMALCVIDTETNVMHFSGANSPLFLFRLAEDASETNPSGFEFITLPADKMPIGIHLVEKDSFTNHTIQLQKGDTIYLFSDGYVDQVGGDLGRKFLKGNFKKMLMDIHHLNVDVQKEIVESNLKKWKGNREQVDDIMVIGLKI